MSDSYPSGSTGDNFDASSSGSQNPSGTSGRMDTVRDEASNLGGQAKDAGRQVTDVAKSEASNVASEAKYQAKNLWREARGQLHDQAGTQQKRVAGGLRSLSDELQTMANSSETDGAAAGLVREVAQRTGSAAGWLDQRDPGSLLNEVKSFARRRPGIFIAAAAAAGLLAGRLARSLADDARSGSGAESGADIDDTPNYTATAGTVPPPPPSREIRSAGTPVHRAESDRAESERASEPDSPETPALRDIRRPNRPMASSRSRLAA